MKPILYLAPIRGYTDNIYRTTWAKYFSGLDIAVAPFISTTSNLHVGNALFKDLIFEQNKLLPVIPQIIGNNVDDFILFAKKIAERGFHTINWNLGCPHPMVARKKRGSGLLPYPEKIDRFLQTFFNTISNDTHGKLPINLSIKTRLGRYNKDEIIKLIPILNRYPLTEIIFHPRTGIQMYKGEPDLDAFEECLLLCTHKIVYNGDITDINSFEYLTKRFPTVNNWMIGRGILSNPFLPSILKKQHQTSKDDLNIIRKFHDDLFKQYSKVLYGPAHITGRMKGFWTYLSIFFQDGKKILKQIRKVTKTEQYRKVVDDFFDSVVQNNSPNR